MGSVQSVHGPDQAGGPNLVPRAVLVGPHTGGGWGSQPGPAGGKGD